MRNQRVLGGVSARSVALAAGLVLSLSAVRAEAQQTVTFTNAGGNNLWSNPSNWIPNIVPINTVNTRFVVVIGENRAVRVDATMPANFTVNSITLPATGRLDVIGGRTIQIGSESSIRGQIFATGGSVIVTRAPGAPVETNLNFTLSAGGGGLYRSAGSSFNLLGASLKTTTGGTLDLRSLQSLSLPATAQGGTSTSQIFADGGTIDLSSVASLQINTGNRIQITAANSGSILLNSLTTLDNVDLDVNNATVQLGALTSIINSSIVWSAGTFTLPSAVSAYFSNGSRVFRVGASGNVLNLSPLQTMTIGGSLTLESLGGRLDLSNAQLTQTSSNPLRINASAGGTIDLSSATSLNNAEIIVRGGSTFAAANVATMTRSSVDVLDGSSLTLPALQQFNIDLAQVLRGFRASNNSTITLPALTTLSIVNNTPSSVVDSIRIEALQNSTINLPAVTSVTSAGGNFSTYLRADGGSVLELNSLATMNGSAQILAAGAGSRIDLPLLTNVQNSVVINASAGATINLPSATSLRNAEITVRGGSTLAAANVTTMTRSSLDILDGSSLTLPVLQQFNIELLQTLRGFRATNNSTITLPALTTLSIVNTLPNFSPDSIRIEALQNSQINLPAVTSVTSQGGTFSTFLRADGGSVLTLNSLATMNGSAQVFAAGANSRVDLPLLTGVQSNVVINASSGGSISAPLLTDFLNAQITNSGGTLVIGRPTSFVNSTLSINSGTVEFAPTLTQINWSNIPTPTSVNNMFLRAFNAATIRGERVERIDVSLTSGFTSLTGALTADTGGLIDLPAVSTIQTSNGATFSVSAAGGGRILLPSVTNLSSFQSITLAGTGSVVELRNAATRTGTSTFSLTSTNQGELQLPTLAMIEASTLNLTANTGGAIRLPLTLPSPSRSTVIDIRSGGRVELPQYTGLTDLRVTIADPQSTFVTGSFNEFERSTLSVTNASFLIPQTITRISGPDSTVYNLLEALNGSSISAPGVTTLEFGSSRIDSSDVTLRASSSSLIDLPRWTTQINADVLSTVDLSSLTTLTSAQGSTLSASGTNSRILANNLRTLGPGTRSQTFRALAGGSLQLAALQSLGSSTDMRFDIGSVTLQLPSLNDLGEGSGRNFTASQGGRIELPALTTLGSVSNVEFWSTFANSRISLPLLQSLGTGSGRLFRAENTSTISAPLLTRLDGADVFLTGAASLQTGTLTSIDNATFSISVPNYTIPSAITSYTARGRGQVELIKVSSGTFSAPSLTSLTIGSDATPGTVQSIVSSGGQINLSGVSSLSRVNGGVLRLDIGFSGVVNLGSMNRLNGVDLVLNNNSTLITAPLQSIDGSSIWVTNRSYTLSNLITEYSTLDRRTMPLFTVDGTGSLLDLTSLRTLRFGNPDAPGQSYGITSRSVIDLSGLTSLQSVNGGRLSFVVSNGSSVRLTGLTSVNDTDLNIFGSTSQVQLGAVTGFSNSTVRAESGGRFVLPAGVTSYQNETGGQITLFSTNFAGSSIDLSSLRSFTFGSTRVANSEYTINSQFGGSINLSGLTSLTRVNGGILNLFATGGTLTLPSVPAFNYVNFSFGTTNLVLPSTVTNIDESTFSVNGSTLTMPSHIQSLSITDRGSVTALRASGTTGRINAESLTTLRLGSTSTPNAQMTIRTENGGAIDLRNITSIELPNNASEPSLPQSSSGRPSSLKARIKAG